jgi:hypothetical protein
MLEKDATRAARGREKAARKRAREERQAHLLKQEQAIQASLAKRDPPWQAQPDRYIPEGLPPKERAQYLDFYQAITAKQSRMLSREWGHTLHAVFMAAVLVDGIPDLSGWNPKARSPRAVFQSLARYLLGKKYQQPPILWTAFEEPYDTAIKLAPVVAHVALGGSLFKAIPGLLPVPLTRKQCHELLQVTGVGFLAAIRQQQAQAHGGSLRLARAWSANRRGGTLGIAKEEAFWDTVIAFFAKNPMLDLSQVGPMVDYVTYRRGMEANFTMKGRTALALLRDVTEWHQTLYRVKVAGGGEAFDPSGFVPYSSESEYRDKSGNHVQEIWVVREILSGKDLAEEGQALKHCVYSYSQSIRGGRTSIWSMGYGPSAKKLTRVLTIEVSNRDKRVAQARGLSNRSANTDEFKILNTWAQSNGIRLGAYM